MIYDIMVPGNCGVAIPLLQNVGIDARVLDIFDVLVVFDTQNGGHNRKKRANNAQYSLNYFHFSSLT